MKMICEGCNNYEISSGGCVTKCYENLLNSNYLSKEYFKECESGMKKNCKSYKKLPKEIGEAI